VRTLRICVEVEKVDIIKMIIHIKVEEDHKDYQWVGEVELEEMRMVLMIKMRDY
jgi:hypothetical protein